MVVLKELILKVSILGQCGDLEKTGSLPFLLLEGVVVLERTDFKQFLFLGGCGGLERPDFEQFLL